MNFNKENEYIGRLYLLLTKICSQSNAEDNIEIMPLIASTYFTNKSNGKQWGVSSTYHFESNPITDILTDFIQGKIDPRDAKRKIDQLNDMKAFW